MDNFAESGLSSEQIELLADTFARINSRYFLGKQYDKEEFSAGFELWQTQENGFVQRYIETMLKEADQDNQNLTIELN